MYTPAFLQEPVLAITGMPGIYELLIIAVIVLLLFGKRLPQTMRSLGTSIVEFKKGMKDDGSEGREEIQQDSAKTEV